MTQVMLLSSSRQTYLQPGANRFLPLLYPPGMKLPEFGVGEGRVSQA